MSKKDFDVNENEELMRFASVYQLPVTNLEAWEYGYNNPAPHVKKFMEIVKNEESKTEKNIKRKKP